eukprot:TRINITY_DN7365_c0_g2_i2.p2 TRINITY_DN7365_c0_g2~~TRINITY_DN7365_c0_g2_i2.p2  ORF type:complete len:169 (-),score=20.23 TRINITY_DN7365_c0_g2_i2:142-648(-)
MANLATCCLATGEKQSLAWRAWIAMRARSRDNVLPSAFTLKRLGASRASEWAQGLPPDEVKAFSELSGEPVREFLTAHCGITFQEAPEVVPTNRMAPALVLSQDQSHPHGSTPPHVVSQRNGTEVQEASSENVTAEMPSVQHLPVSELLRLLQEDPANGLQSDVIVSF